jgi:hypothetical protein
MIRMKKNCGMNYSQKSSPRRMYIRTMFGYNAKLEGYISSDIKCYTPFQAEQRRL